jgi:hypothetical protein
MYSDVWSHWLLSANVLKETKMKKIFFTTLLAIGMMTFIACGKKDKHSNNYSCSMYPNAVTVTNPQQIQMFFQINQGVYPPPGNYNGNNNGANGYGTAYICVDRNVYYQYANGGGGYPPGGGGNNYCYQHPYDPQCQMGGGGGGCVTVCDSTGWCYCY